jgi:hypothetical protein
MIFPTFQDGTRFVVFYKFSLKIMSTSFIENKDAHAAPLAHVNPWFTFGMLLHLGDTRGARGRRSTILEPTLHSRKLSTPHYRILLRVR